MASFAVPYGVKVEEMAKAMGQEPKPAPKPAKPAPKTKPEN